MLEFKRICGSPQAVNLGGVSDCGFTCAFVAGLPKQVKRLLCTSFLMDTLDVNQLLERARITLKDKLVAELIVTAAKPEQLSIESTSTNDPQSDIVCPIWWC